MPAGADCIQCRNVIKWMRRWGYYGRFWGLLGASLEKAANWEPFGTPKEAQLRREEYPV